MITFSSVYKTLKYPDIYMELSLNTICFRFFFCDYFTFYEIDKGFKTF